MPVTLAQAQNLTQDKLYMGVIDEFRKDTLMDLMLFDDCVQLNGGSTLNYVYDRVSTLPTAGFRAINAEYVPQEAAVTPFTVALKIFGGSFQVDRVIQNDVRGITNQLALQLDQKIKAAKALFSDTFINGDVALNVNAFDGLSKAVTGSTTELNTAATIDLSTSALIDANWKVFQDMLRKLEAKLDGAPSAWICNKEMYAVWCAIADRAASYQETRDTYGNKILKIGGATPIIQLGDKPGSSNPIIAIGAASGETDIYAVRIAMDGVHCVTPSGAPLIQTYMPNLQLPGAVKTGEVEMVTAMALKATRAAGVVRKIKIA